MILSIKGLKSAVVVVATLALLAFVFLFQTSSHAASPISGDGGETFKAKCAACHGADGAGATAVGKAMKLRDLGSGDVQSQTDDQLYEIVANGKGKMPGYEKSLGAEKCKELVAYIRTFKK
jgi:mono/diheme cytochrome c family protein